MRPQKTFQLYSIILLCFSTFGAAYPWPRWLPELDSLIVRRADSSSSSSATDKASATATTAPKSTATASATGKNSDSSSATGTNSGSNTGSSGSKTTSAAKTSGSGASATGDSSGSGNSTSYDATNAAGGISLLTPAATSTAYFKIGDFVTFKWNYTSLLATPTAVDIMATCTANKVLYTIAANQTVTNATGAVTWDTSAYQSTAVGNPLLTQTYTLIIYDAASSITAASEPGYLSVFDTYKFGMYVPQAYTPLSDWTCATCSGALSDMERRALGLMVGMSVITVLSFTWFVGGLAVVW